MLPYLLMSHIIIKSMLKRSPSYRSAIINVASSTGTRSVRYFHSYAASKAYVNFLSLCLADEYRDRIDVMAVRFSSVSTDMILKTKPMFSIEPEEAAEAVFKRLGWTEETWGHWKHVIE